MKNFLYFLSSVLAGLSSNLITIYIQKSNSSFSVNWVIFIYLLLMLIIGIFAYKHFRKSMIDKETQEALNRLQNINNLHDILYKYATHPQSLRIIDSNGKEYCGGHDGNTYWKAFSENVVKQMGLSHLRYSNLGSEYHLEDLKNGKKYEIPTDNKLEETVVASGIKNGQILLIKQNT